LVIDTNAPAVSSVSAAESTQKFVSGATDPNYNTKYQGASAQTFAANYGFTVGTSANDLKVSTSTWTDPATFTIGKVSVLNGMISGTTVNKLNYAYYSYAPNETSGNARDYQWIQNYAGTITKNPSLDTPWNGTIWDMRGGVNRAVVFPVVDHGPLPEEALEYTVYLGNNPYSTNLSDWHLAVLDQVYLQGWEADSVALADGYTTVWRAQNDPNSTLVILIPGLFKNVANKYNGVTIGLVYEVYTKLTSTIVRTPVE
jgi:hypothetical protein